MIRKYFIVDVIQGYDYKYGDIAVIRANPVIVSPSGNMTASESTSSAEHFLIPLENAIVQSIIAQARLHNGIWEANMDDFEYDFIFIEDENRRMPVHRHISFYEM